MQKKTKTIIKSIIGASISIIFLVLILRNIDPHEVISTIKNANLLYIVLVIVFYLSSFFFRTLRWNQMLLKVKGKKFIELFSILMVGWGANNILPMRLGEVIRAYLLKIKKHQPFSYAFSTIMLEKVLDGFTLLLFVGILFVLYSMPKWVDRLSMVAFAVFIILLIGSFIALHWEEKLYKINPFSKLNPVLESVIAGMESLKNTKIQGTLWIYSIFVWLFEAAGFYFTAKSLAIDIPLFVILLSVVAVNFGIMMPSAPGYIGTFEIFAVLSLTSFGVTDNIAMAYAITIHGVQYFTTTFIALGIIFKEGISFKELYSRSENNR